MDQFTGNKTGQTCAEQLKLIRQLPHSDG